MILKIKTQPENFLKNQWAQIKIIVQPTVI